jgi:hypothetical protein
VFLDSDVVCRADITSIGMDASVDDAAVFVSQHDYVPKQAVKMDGCVQTTYPCKNWSSVMLFDNDACRRLTPAYVNTATGLDLHRFHWTRRPVGSLPLEWNWLVGEYEPNPNAKILHYTNGGPWFRDYQDCDHAKDWLDEHTKMTSPPMRQFAQASWMTEPICG